ncbi:M50 family metallopeptidase [Neobacillus niacini]|uniref:M50 family metallopeptidase n=1 Tax=Neobacillus niacini TaxID=86668 RepID=UPI0021CB7308|nr:M50 family metallopeptidase [Neobacillus niacini]MCM3767820.1 M50 family metallopeptidase [Neobacillus niacini]
MILIREKLSIKFFLFLLAAFLLIHVPFIGNYIRVINTLIHESGHAFIALLGGDVEMITLLMNSEGATYISSSTWIGSFFTSLAGYTFASFAAFVSFLMIGRKKQILLIDILLGFILINLIFWVRNPYGIFWLCSFAGGFLLLLIKGTQSFRDHLLLMIASILLVDSVQSAFEIFYLSVTHPQYAGDATNLARLTVIPAPVWGSIFLLQALWFCYYGLKRGYYKLGFNDKAGPLSG